MKIGKTYEIHADGCAYYVIPKNFTHQYLHGDYLTKDQYDKGTRLERESAGGQGAWGWDAIETVEPLDLNIVSQEVRIVLNSDYTAVVTRAHTVVGCQTIANSVILSVADAIKQIQK